MKYLHKQLHKSIPNIASAVKIVAVAIVAILLAQLLQLDYSISAGVVAILSVSPTKKETIKTARDRFIAFLLALLLAKFSFLLLGLSINGFFLFLVLYISLCQWKQWRNSMAMNTVLISHFITSGALNWSTLYNEFGLFILGAGCGILVNLHLRKDQKKMNDLKQEIDTQIQYILLRMSQRVVNASLTDYNGSCLISLEDMIRNAQNLAHENFMNQFGDSDTADLDYLDKREEQLHILYNMYKKAKALDSIPITAAQISTLLLCISEQFLDFSASDNLLLQLEILWQSLKQEKLPVSRNEFEIRATLFALLQELEEFLSIHKTLADITLSCN